MYLIDSISEIAAWAYIHIILCCFKSFLSLSYLKRFYAMMSSSSLSPSIIVGCSLLTWKTEMAQSRRLWIKPPVPSPVPRTPLFRREPTPETNSRHAARRSVAVATEVWSWDEQLCQMHCYCSLRWLTYSSEAWLSLCLKVSRVINLGKPASSYTYYCLAMFPAACLYTWAVLPWARI